MMKRVLSLLLCLVMVLSFAAPVVQANGTDDIYVSDGSLGNVIVGENIQMDNVVIDGANITTPVEPAVPGDAASSPVLAEPEPTVPAELEDLFPEGSASETYADGTTVSVEGIPEDGSVSIQEADDQVKDIVENHVAENIENATELFTYDVSVQDAQGEDWQPTGTVKMELEMPDVKLHKYSKVYVVHVDDNGEANIIPAKVTEDGKIAFETPGFSTFAGFTVDFEYNGETFSINGLTEILVSQVMDTLKMPLYIEDVANVTFTDETLVSVTAQEGDWLLTSLKAFQTTETLTVTMNDGAVYEIVVTDASYPGIYAVTENGTYEGVGNYSSDLSGGDGTITILLDGDGEPAINGNSAYNWITDDKRFVVKGTGTLYMELQHADIYGTGATTSSVNDLYWDLMQIRVTDGATLVIRLGASFEGDETINIRYRKNDNSGRPYDVFPMFDVDNGNLLFRWSNYSTAPSGLIASNKNSFFGTRGANWADNGASFVPLYLDGRDYATNIDPANEKDHPLILVRNTSSSQQHVFLEDINFKNAKYRAIRCYANELGNLHVKDCVFENTVRVDCSGSENGGGAINIEASVLWDNLGYRVDVYNFTVDNCKFDSCEGNNDGGAIESKGRVYKATIKNSLFQNFNTKQMSVDGTKEYAAHGGAVAFKGYTGTLLFDSNEFKNCVVNQYGGAVYFESTANSNNNWSKFLKVTFQNCYFYQCISKTQHGGAISVNAQMHTLEVLGCKFEECKSLSNGGAISIMSKVLPNFNSWQEDMDSSYGPNNTFHYQFAANGNYYGSIDTFLVDDYNGKQTQFLDCKASTSGGAIEFAQNTYVKSADINDTLIQGCKAVNNGSAIFMSSPVVESFDFNNVTVKQCSFIMGLPGTGAAGEKVHATTGFQLDENGQYIDAPDDPNARLIITTEAAGTIRSTGATTSILTMTDCTVTDNYSYSNGGGLYWNACYNRGILDECYAVVTKCTFARNVSGYHGGGIYCESKLTIRGCQIYENYADMYGGGIAQQVYNNAGRLLLPGEQTNLTITSYKDANGVVTETNIYNNYSDVRGGGISIRANPTASILVPAEGQEIVKHAVIFNLQGANIYDNTARLDGGGVSFMDVRDSTGNADQGATWTTEDAIKYNNAEVESYDKSINITDGIVYGNRAGIDQDWSSNILRNKAKISQTWVNDFTELEQQTEAGGSGGGIYMSSSENTTLTINSGSIYDNSANWGNGGGIYLQGNNALCTVSSGTVGFYRDANNAIVKLPNKALPKVVDSTYSLGNGGGIAIYNGARIEMTGGEICYNEAYVGGGIAVREGSSMLSDVDATTNTAALVDSNTATSAGGGIAIHGSSTMTMNGGTITNNTSAHGGAISVMSSGDPATIRPVDEDGKPITEDADGNPIVEKWGMIFNGGLIQYNLSTTLGGGICLSDNSTMQFNDGEVKNNWAATRTYEEVTKEDGSVVTEAVYTYIAGQEGGGIAVCQGSLMDTYGGIIESNNSHSGAGVIVRGGAVLNMFPVTTKDADGNVTVTGQAKIQNNKASSGGGGISVYPGSKVLIEGGDILNNEALSGGGVWMQGNLSDAVDAYTTTFDLIGGSITGNKAIGTAAGNGQGGGIHADRYCEVKVAGNKTTGEPGVISNNTAAKGGGVYLVWGAHLTLSDGHLINNHAVGTCNYPSTLHENHGLAGVGGGVYVCSGYKDDHPSTFTLTGEDIAIYGNIADYAADDVFSNGDKTKLNVKQVKEMNLAGYEFSPEAWFEDYCINETNYTSGLNLASADSGITNGNVYRYRGATANHRVRISETNVTEKVNLANTFVCMTLGIPEAVPDTVVLDYGLPVVINIMDNDVILNVDELANTGKISSNGPNLENQEKIYEHNGIIYGTELDAQFMQGAAVNDQLVLTHGVATLNRTEGSVAYQMNSNDLIMDSHDTLWYAVYHKSPVVYEDKPEGYYYYGKVEAIPATTIYFEDNFGTAITYSAEGTAEWTDTSTPKDLTNLDYAQSQDRVGSLGDKDLDADNVYGFDPRYNLVNKYSFGSAKKVTVSETTDANGNTVVNDASAVFTFKGTGFDIISHSNKRTGMVMISVYEGNAVDSSKLITTYMVDTWYQGTGTNNLYQIPAIKTDLTKVANPLNNNEMCGYGTYTVKVYVAWTWWADHEQRGYGSWDFYLDAIRIYNPAGDGVLTDASGEVISTVIRDAYVADDEAWPRYEELRNLLISANTFSNITDSNLSGAIFIDGNASLDDSSSSGTTPDEDDPLYGKKPSVVDYANFGPNNELYLSDGQGVAFALDTGAASLPEGVKIASVQIGMRNTSGFAGYIKLYNAKTTTFADAEAMQLDSTTDRYYDITDMDGGNVVIYCESSFSPVSITNVKITYTADPYGTGSGSVEGGSESDIPGVGQIFRISNEIGQSALNSFVSETETETAPELTLKYPSLSFEGEVNYNVYFDAQNLGSLTAADLGLAVFSTENTEGTVETADDVILGVEEKDGLYMATTNGIPAKNMGDRLYFKVFAKLADGSYVYSDMRSYNAVDYALDALNNSENMSLKALVVAMLNYGAAAQSFFGYNTNSLMNSALTAEHQNLISGFSAETLNGLTAIDAAKAGDFAATDGFAGKYPTVYFDGAFEINYNVIPGNAVDGVVTLYFWNEDTYAAVDTLTAQNADLAVPMVNDNGTWKACSQQIAAKDLDKTVYAAAVYESEGTAYCTGILTYSIAAYCQEQAADTTSNMSAFAQATAIYGSAAKVFFG